MQIYKLNTWSSAHILPTAVVSAWICLASLIVKSFAISLFHNQYSLLWPSMLENGKNESKSRSLTVLGAILLIFIDR